MSNERGTAAGESQEGARQDAYSRRRFLGVGTAALVAGRAHAQMPDDTARAEHDHSYTHAGPENPPVAAENPDAETPPPTDHGDVPGFWYSFALAHKRVQEGGWARQVTVKDFPISTTIAGVNMRLTAGGVRELHWHQAGEWSIMLSGNARLTAIDDQGRSYVNDVTQNDLWYFPAGLPHTIQGLGPDGCEFLLVFDDGSFSEFDTTLISDWLAHTPPEVLAKNWGVPQSALADLPKNELYIFQTALPGALAEDKRAAAGFKPPSPVSFDFKMHTMPPTRKTTSGEVRIIDSHTFPVCTTVAAAHLVVHPGGMREMHWHPNADEWQYYIAGQGRITLFLNGGKARTADFQSGDVGYVPRSMGHYIENTGDTDLIFLETFKSDHYQDISLSDWVTHTPPGLVMQHLHISPGTLAAIPKDKRVIVPG